MEVIINGHKVIYSPEDHDEISKYTWYISESYCRATIDSKTIKMHRFIMKNPKGKVIDHINNNRLDNRRENLRITDRNGNAQNKTKRSNTTSKYIGVSYNTRYKKFVAQAQKDGKPIGIGKYSDEIEAAKARDLFVVHELPNSLNTLNFPELKSKYVETPYSPKIIKEQEAKIKVKSVCEPVIGNENIVRLLIPSRGDIVVLIDKEEFERVKYNKYCQQDGGYIRSRYHMLHRFIMNENNEDVFIDHIDGNKYNNTKANLRRSDYKLNAQNKSKIANTTSKYIGVSYITNRKKWAVSIRINGKGKFLGHFATEIEAARARDNYIKTNLPESHYKLNNV